ncbi:agamous-like MADS-box protein AGL62 [Actinidia eriantha]|uniref:agamous-like MADS-box protein AGL62 n=1 Tax=Actinidia eriantha TaxID=165200 RepID=UPI00258C3605|nr:agamous-like MADS-box protein AGL62 [Actinidia eriantha]
MVLVVHKKNIKGGIELKQAGKPRLAFLRHGFSVLRRQESFSTLCGADGNAKLFTPKEKTHAFGNPRIYSVVNKFHCGIPPPNNLKEMLMKQVSELEELVEAEKRRGEELKKALEADKESHHLLRIPMEELSLEELGQLKAALEELREKVYERVNELMKGVQIMGRDQASSKFLKIGSIQE